MVRKAISDDAYENEAGAPKELPASKITQIKEWAAKRRAEADGLLGRRQSAPKPRGPSY